MTYSATENQLSLKYNCFSPSSFSNNTDSNLPESVQLKLPLYRITPCYIKKKKQFQTSSEANTSIRKRQCFLIKGGFIKNKKSKHCLILAGCIFKKAKNNHDSSNKSISKKQYIS